MSDGFMTDVMTLQIYNAVGKKEDGTIADATNRDTLMGRTYKMKQMLENLDIKVSSSDSDIFFVIDFLFSDEDERIEWAFRQTCIGNALNQVGNFNSDALAACHSVDEIAANSELITMIGGNADIVSICAKNETLRGKLVDYLNEEDTLIYGYGYSKFNIGDVITIKHYGKDRKFRVIDKDHYTKGRILIFPEIISETFSWEGAGVNNYSSSMIREYMNSTILAGFSEKIQLRITTPVLECHNGKSAITCRDKIYPLSTVQLGQAKGTANAPDEGKAIAWFNSNQRRIRYDATGKATTYWTRTPNSGSTNYAW